MYTITEMLFRWDLVWLTRPSFHLKQSYQQHQHQINLGFWRMTEIERMGNFGFISSVKQLFSENHNTWIIKPLQCFSVSWILQSFSYTLDVLPLVQRAQSYQVSNQISFKHNAGTENFQYLLKCIIFSSTCGGDLNYCKHSSIT